MNDHAPPVIRILLADDSAPVRMALRIMLNAHPRMEVVGEATNGFEAIELVEALAPDLVLMDLRMPELDGLAATRMLRSRPGCPRIVMLSAHSDPAWNTEATELGVERYVYKGDSSSEIIAAVLGE